MIKVDQLIYVQRFKSEDPSLRNLNTFAPKLKVNDFVPFFVCLKENISNERKFIRLVFMSNLDEDQWIKDQVKMLNIGSDKNKSGKRVFRMINPWIENFSFKNGKIKKFLTL